MKERRSPGVFTKTRGAHGHMKHEGSYETYDSDYQVQRARRSSKTPRTERMTGQERKFERECIRENDRMECEHPFRKQKTNTLKKIKRKKK